MKSRLFALMSVGALLAAATFTTPSFAQEAPPKDPSGEHLKGLEVMVRPSLGGAPGNSPVTYAPTPTVRIAGEPPALLNGATPYGAGFTGAAFLGYRFHPLVSAGMRAGLRSSAAESLSDGSTGLSRSSWNAGFYVRGYPLALNPKIRKHVDPWVSVGVGYMRDLQTFQRPAPTSTGGSVQADWTLDHHAVAVPIGVGIDYRVHPMFSVGPSFEYAIASGLAACAKQSAAGFSGSGFCSNESPGKEVLTASTYGVWSAGLDVKLTVF